MVALREVSVEVIKTAMLCTLAVPAIEANPHNPLALLHSVVMVIFLADCLTKEENSLFGNFILNLEFNCVNLKVSRIDLIVIFHMEGLLTTPMNHMTIITHDNIIKHAR